MGETYNIGGWNEKQNVEVVKTICQILDELKPQLNGQSYESLIAFVKDRPGHDLRYAIDASKLNKELGWKPSVTFEQGLERTIDWYLNNEEWMERIATNAYRA